MSTTKTKSPKWVLLATLLLVALGGRPALAQAGDPGPSDERDPVQARVVISQEREFRVCFRPELLKRIMEASRVGDEGPS